MDLNYYSRDGLPAARRSRPRPAPPSRPPPPLTPRARPAARPPPHSRFSRIIIILRGPHLPPARSPVPPSLPLPPARPPLDPRRSALTEDASRGFLFGSSRCVGGEGRGKRACQCGKGRRGARERCWGAGRAGVGWSMVGDIAGEMGGQAARVKLRLLVHSVREWER